MQQSWQWKMFKAMMRYGYLKKNKAWLLPIVMYSLISGKVFYSFLSCWMHGNAFKTLLYASFLELIFIMLNNILKTFMWTNVIYIYS